MYDRVITYINYFMFEILSLGLLGDKYFVVWVLLY